MAISRQRFFLFGLIIGTIIFYLYGYKLARPSDKALKAPEKLIEKSEADVIKEEKEPTKEAMPVTLSPRTPPSLEEDWGKVTCPETKLSEGYKNLHYYITDATLPCVFKVTVGGSFKGPLFYGEKWMCLDKKFNIKPKNCTILSFGISKDWTFDDEIDVLFGCKVYAFDPTIGVKDHDRSKNIKFFNFGIADGPGRLGWGKVDTYSAILKMLNLENSVIDYLKMDVEASEYKFFKDVFANTPNLLKNVKQIGMELHLPGHIKEAWHFLQHLDCLGFKVMFHNVNPTYPVILEDGRQMGSHYEIVWGLERDW